jgi:hypothetical protein
MYWDAQQPVGSEVAYSHGDGCLDRGESPDYRQRLYIKRTPKGWVYFCHNCGWSGFRPAKGVPPSETKRQLVHRLEEGRATVVIPEELTLPRDFTQVIPPAGLVWLLQYITQDQIEQYQIGYSKQLNRVILPVYWDDELIAYQGRALGEYGKDNPKYLTWKKKAVKHPYFMADNVTDTKILIIVEDMLSAIKVSCAGVGVAVLGSYVADAVFDLIRQYDAVRVWLDYDKAKVSLASTKRIRSITGKPATPIITDLDPKDYGEGFINNKVKE